MLRRVQTSLQMLKLVYKLVYSQNSDEVLRLKNVSGYFPPLTPLQDLGLALSHPTFKNLRSTPVLK